MRAEVKQGALVVERPTAPEGANRPRVKGCLAGVAGERPRSRQQFQLIDYPVLAADGRTSYIGVHVAP